MTTVQPLAGRVALVTGGSRGVGRAVALRLAADGAAVAVNYRRDHDSAHDVVGRIEAAGGRSGAYRASVADPSETAAMAEAVTADLGPVDLVVSNAGTASRGKTICETGPEEFEALMKVHALGPLALIRHLLPSMRAAGRADIVMISSVAASSAPALAAPYTMAKAAMEAAMRTLAREERGNGIRVNVVAPGLVATEMGARLVAASTGGGRIEALEAALPFGRACRPEDIAGAVAFLVSADGAYVTGQRLVIDGGGPEASVMHNL